MKISEITKNNYNNEIEDYEGTVLLDFFADWCTPCKMLSKTIDKIANESDVKICKINIETETELANRFGIMSIPTLIIMKNGKVIERSVGIKSKKDILDMIKQ